MENNDFQGNFGFNNGMNNFDLNNDMYKDPMFNPIAQYEQAFTYYKYLCMQMDYKIKCKEYEKLCANNSSKSASPSN